MEKAVRDPETHGVSLDQVDHVIPHQANVRIVESLAQRLEIPMDKFFYVIWTSMKILLCRFRSLGSG